jgi:hypothetical protein
MDNEPKITYCHTDNPNIRFHQYKKDPVPVWAVDIRDEMTYEIIENVFEKNPDEKK